MLLLSNGNVLIIWSNYINLHGTVIDGSGNTVKSEFRINEYTIDNQDWQEMLLLSNGNVLITW